MLVRRDCQARRERPFFFHGRWWRRQEGMGGREGPVLAGKRRRRAVGVGGNGRLCLSSPTAAGPLIRRGPATHTSMYARNASPSQTLRPAAASTQLLDRTSATWPTSQATHAASPPPMRSSSVAATPPPMATSTDIAPSMHVAQRFNGGQHRNLPAAARHQRLAAAAGNERLSGPCDRRRQSRHVRTGGRARRIVPNPLRGALGGR